MKRVANYGVISLFLLLVGSGLTIIGWQSFAISSTQKAKIILATTFVIGAGEQKFRAFYLPEPNEGFQVAYNVSEGKIKWSFSPASIFEETLGYLES